MNNLCSRMNTMNPISSAAAEAIASNEDLLQEILIRVPAKPLLKFKSVSKQWLSLISSSHFCRCHAQRHREAAALLFHFRGPYVPSGGLNIVSLNDQCSKVPSFDFVSDSSVRILQSCNGLLLCRSFDNSRLKYFVCNPTTKKFKVVSFLPRLEGFVRAVNLAYDPLKSAHFKIIAIRELIQLVGRRFQMDIYSSKTDSWGSRVVNFAAENNIRFEIGVFCNGAIHWDSKSSTSLFFEVETMNLEKMPMPMPIAPQGSSAEIGRYLGESCRHLQLAIGYMPPLQIDIFEMASDYSNWFMKHRVNLETVMKAIPEINLYGEEGVNPVHSLCVLPSEKDEASKVLAFVNWKAISYDFNDGTFRKLCDLEPCPILHHTRPFLEAFHVFQYFESLACV